VTPRETRSQAGRLVIKIRARVGDSADSGGIGGRDLYYHSFRAVPHRHSVRPRIHAGEFLRNRPGMRGEAILRVARRRSRGGKST